MVREKTLHEKTSTLHVGESIYLEADIESIPSLRRQVVAKSRWPAHMKGWKLKTSVHTAVGAVLGEIGYLVRVERTF